MLWLATILFRVRFFSSFESIWWLVIGIYIRTVREEPTVAANHLMDVLKNAIDFLDIALLHVCLFESEQCQCVP